MLEEFFFEKKLTMKGLELKLAAINCDIELGRKQRAADKLRKLICQNPEEIDLWFITGELYYNSGFLDMAGRYWLFYPSVEPHITKAIDIYKESVNFSSTQMLRDIKFSGSAENLPLYSQNIIESLEKDAFKSTGFVPRYNNTPYVPEKEKFRPPSISKIKQNFGCLLGIVLIVFVITLLIVGAVTILGRLF